MDERCLIVYKCNYRLGIVSIEFDEARISCLRIKPACLARDTDDFVTGVSQLFVQHSSWPGAGTDDNNLQRAIP
jgi:hypothetical protein